MRLIQEGPRDAKIVIVGEAPGAREASMGQPFVGGSGQELNKMLHAAGLQRMDCFITNVTHVQPPKNRFDWFLKPKIKPEYIAGVVQLKTDLENIRPNICICMGGQALRALTNKGSIDKWRGSILDSTLLPGLKVIGTYHPAYVLRVYDYKAVVEMDLRKCAAQSEFPEIIRPTREFILDPDNDCLVHDVVEEMLHAEWLAVDIECFETATGWRLSCVGFSDRPDRAIVLTPDKHAQAIRTLCTSNVRKVYQNGTFDTTILRQNGIECAAFAWDTMLGMHAIYPECASSKDETSALTGTKKGGVQSALRKGLAFQTSIWTDEPFYKDDGKLWKETQDLEMFYRYNALDATCTREIRDRQDEEITELGIRKQFDHNMAMIPVVNDMTDRGILIDLPVRKQMSDQIDKELVNLQDFLDVGAGRPINVKSPDVRDLLFNQLGLPVKKRSDKTDEPSADKDVINELAASNPHPLLMTILEIRERRDLKERYLNVVLDADNRMRCQFDITGTRTFRLASRGSIHGTGTNMQTIPAGLRRMFIADEGYVMLNVDYSQAEARVVAYLARCQALIDLFEDPTADVHIENAARFYSIGIDRVTDEQRYTAKRTVHASNYGMKVYRFWQIVNNDARETGIRITMGEAGRCQEMYFMLYPEIKSVYWEDVRRELYMTRALINPQGFRRDFLGRAGNDKFDFAAYSYKPQSAIGVETRMAMIECFEHMREEFPMLANVHDSILGLCKVDEVEEVARGVQELMNIPIPIYGQDVHIPTDVEVGYNWGKRVKKPDGTIDNPRGLRKLDQ